MSRRFIFLYLPLFWGSLFARHVPPKWQSTEYIQSYQFISIIPRGIEPNPFVFFKTMDRFDPIVYKDVEYAEIIHVRPMFLSRFYHEVLPSLENPVILLISLGDESFPSNCHLDGFVEEFIHNDKILHIFAQNCDYKGPSKKVSHFPIGLDYHTIAYKHKRGAWGETGSPITQEKLFHFIQRTLKPTWQRKVKAYVDFQLSDNMHGEFDRYLEFGEDRESIFQRLLPTGLIDHGPRMSRSNLWRTKGNYAFSISPPGNGLDCHRTWEDLILGCIVIVKSSPIDELYENLPVVIVNDWSEITEDNLKKWLEKYSDAFTNPEYRKRLTSEYWLGKMMSIQNDEKSKAKKQQ